jgi:hypothetical protein
MKRFSKHYNVVKNPCAFDLIKLISLPIFAHKSKLKGVYDYKNNADSRSRKIGLCYD